MDTACRVSLRVSSFSSKRKSHTIMERGTKNFWTNKLLLAMIMCQWCTLTRSDYNVIIPELCTLPEPINVNLTWIYDIVHAGLHHTLTDEQRSQSPTSQQKVKLNILGPEDLCDDGSQGLLQFISMANADPSGQIIASLEPHLCPSAGAFAHLRQKPFISWTCPKGPGIISFKPMVSEVVIAVQRLITYFDWNHIVLTKSKSDTSSFCDEVGASLRQQYLYPSSDDTDNEEEQRNANNKERNNGGGDGPNSNKVPVTVTVLGNFEDFNKVQSPSSLDSILGSADSVFACVSYCHGLSLTLDSMVGRNPTSSSFSQLRHKLNKLSKDGDRLPFVLLPEWPLPIEILHPDLSMMAVVTDLHQFPYPSPTSLDSDRSSTNSGEGQQAESTKIVNKLLEKLFAQLILKSVKAGLELPERNGQQSQKQQRETTTTAQHHLSQSTVSHSTHGHHFSSKPSPFYFSAVHYENGRWHTIVNLSNEDNKLSSPVHSSNKSQKERDIFSTNRSHKKNGESAGTPQDDLISSWVHILLGTGITTLIVLSTIFISVYFRNKSEKKSFGGHPSHNRKLSRRQRIQGPYKIILTSQDIIFGPSIVHTNPTQEEELLNEQNVGGSASQSSRLPQFSSSITRDGHSGGEDEKPDLLKGSHGTLRKSSSTNMTGDQIIVAGSYRARYKGDMVHLRRLDTNVESLQIKTKAMGVLETLHGLRHENVNAMLGCLTQGIPSLVWEYCSRGSLYDIIQHTDIKLDWAFKLSLLTDLVRGMRYLHMSLVRVHGNLSSHNCVVDARWVLKITDYGLASFYEAQGLPAEEKSPKELLWRAPELIREENCKKFGSQAGDVYSFAIIVQEVLVRGEPYCMLALSPEEILEKVKRPPPLIRPSVSKGVAPPEAINIMRQCWAESPDMRPDFNMIHDLFKTLNHGRKANIVDTMFQMLEKYSNNLEELIRERTEQLDLEKKKTEQLLNRMLPSTVAEKLKLGLPVDPEEFSEVTIYFSDIVGFTTISAYSTPFEVVDLLNDLYTSFDATINDYNVYKVETIGDAYMVVGGAPIWSVDHADQIATMALDLLYQSGKFVIRHLPFTPLRLRIGLHTGPCCAGVVGLTMPRYCLFGDTVNTASRMESTGSAWRIHISGETKAKLDSIGGYIIQYRGMTDIKGKGQMPTFWLLGKEGFDRELPKPPGPKLDEKLIMYGRTGVISDSIVRCASVNDELEVTSSTGSVTTTNMPPPRYGGTKPKYGLFSGDNVRGLSPAEQVRTNYDPRTYFSKEEVAHQLLNGRPASRGLRRQFSLDQGTGVHRVTSSANSSFRKTPSLEEPKEHHSKSSVMLTRADSLSDRDKPSTSAYSSTISSIKGSVTSPNVSGIRPILEVISTPSTPCPPDNGDEKDMFNLIQEFENDDAESSKGNKSNNDSSNPNLIIHTCQKSSKSSGKTPPVLMVLEESPVLTRKSKSNT